MKKLMMTMALLAMMSVSASQKTLSFDGEVYTFHKYQNEEIELFEGIDYGFTLPWGSEDTVSVSVPVRVSVGVLEVSDLDMRLVGDSHAGELGNVKIYTDTEFRKMIVPSVAKSKWDDEGEEWSYENGTTEWEWPKSVWPDDVAVEGRYWAVAPLKAQFGNCYGLTHFAVTLNDSNEVKTKTTNCQRAHVASLPVEKVFGGSTCTLPDLSRDKNWWLCPNTVAKSENRDGQWFDFCTAYDGGKMAIQTKGAGRLVVTYYTDGDVFSFTPTGRNIVNYSTEYSDKWLCRWGEAVQTLTVEVSAATTVTLAYDDWSDMFFEDIAFYPADEKSVNIRPMFIEDCDYGDNCGFQYLRGYVTGDADDEEWGNAGAGA